MKKKCLKYSSGELFEVSSNEKLCALIVITITTTSLHFRFLLRGQGHRHPLCPTGSLLSVCLSTFCPLPWQTWIRRKKVFWRQDKDTSPNSAPWGLVSAALPWCDLVSVYAEASAVGNLSGVQWWRQFPLFLSQLSCFSGLKVNACSNSCVLYVFLLALLSYLNRNVKQSWWRLASNEMTEWSLTTFIIWSRVKAPPEPLDFTIWIRFQVILKMHIMHVIDRHRSELNLSVLRYHTDRSICVKVTALLRT